MKLHLVRHGETVWHDENKYTGHTDIPLTNKGYEQANSLVAWARLLELGAIYTSDLIRSIETAKPMASALGLEVKKDSRLREVNFGEIEGLSPQEMNLNFPEIRKSFLSFPADTILPQGESGRIALQRALPALREILSSNGQQDVVFVGHGTLIRLIVCHFLGIELNLYRKVFPRISNACKFSLLIYDVENMESLDALNSRAGLLSFDNTG